MQKTEATFLDHHHTWLLLKCAQLQQIIASKSCRVHKLLFKISVIILNTMCRCLQREMSLMRSSNLQRCFFEG
ncbi:uncharacterized protein PHALS_14774 [Plasmopara halstedii]|uniref:Uncharacterized protein n=1 Tax=Plasmopara halstedii TaxID=4781 RepID=A0A0P1AR91_PLAHL|nr:uncharacterized protein PHALS_14774 [Plasmopara halstedii]CEG44104.1 hypothetical protein PHALS_14774 [Plasmopara halstedii]|eukprot:XP_024580473.1 hypothetical protein PHALS_14774 [Plasmopara halstedii]